MLKALRGTKDILPEETDLWQFIEQSARDIFSKYRYREIRTPIIEEAALFIRSIGDYTDIVQKEMYVFSDRGGRKIALRPEATASIVRAYLENSIMKKESLSKLFYIGPMFRSERPQKGRQRQFHQLGVEAIGSDNPFLDVEVISMATHFLNNLGVKDFNLNINTLGCGNDKKATIEENRKRIYPYLDSLCDECKTRYNKNVLRIFDCKNAGCKEVVKKVGFENVLCNNCERHFEKVKRTLEEIGVNFMVDPTMVRGLDYYTRTVFEINLRTLGAKDAVCAGGRYDDLVADMGGRPTPAIGFAFGIERLLFAVQDISPKRPSTDVFMATAEERFYGEAFRLMCSLRNSGFSCDIDYGRKSLKAQMKRAEKVGARLVIIFGPEEFERSKVVLRDMQKAIQREVGLVDIISEVTTLICL